MELSDRISELEIRISKLTALVSVMAERLGVEISDNGFSVIDIDDSVEEAVVVVDSGPELELDEPVWIDRVAGSANRYGAAAR